MSWDSTLVKIASYTVRGVLRSVGGRVPKDRYKALLTGVVAGVLAEHPDMTVAQAARRAETATGDKLAPELASRTPGAAGAATIAAGNGSMARQTSNSANTPATKKKTANVKSTKTTTRKNTRKPATRKPTARKRTARKATRR